MLANNKSQAVSIHEMAEVWDAGPVLFKKYGDCDYSRCFLCLMLEKIQVYFLLIFCGNTFPAKISQVLHKEHISIVVSLRKKRSTKVAVME